MKQIIILITVLSCISAIDNAQTTINVTDQTIKIGSNSEEVLYFGFAEGDQILFSFSEAGGKELKEIEVLEYPSNSIFSDYKTSKIENKTIQVRRRAIYKFRFFNGHLLAGRICKIKIQRIPTNEQFNNFVTGVTWTTRQDTNWNIYTRDIVVGYDTTYTVKNRKELVRIDTLITELFSKTERVHSETAIGKTQYSRLNVFLPENTYFPDKSNPYEAREVIAWSYWIGAGNKATEEYERANKNLSNGITTLGALSGYGALASLAITGISLFKPPTVGDNVQYKFITVQNGLQNIFDSGNGIAASGRNDRLLQGAFTIELYNDNFREGIDVTVKVVAVQIIKKWENKKYSEHEVKPRYEKRIYREPVISTSKVLMMIQQ